MGRNPTLTNGGLRAVQSVAGQGVFVNLALPRKRPVKVPSQFWRQLYESLDSHEVSLRLVGIYYSV